MMYIQTFIVVIWVDRTKVGFRRHFHTTSFAVFMGIAEAVGQKMLVVDLAIHGKFALPFTVIDFIDSIQGVFSFVGAFAVITS